MINFDDIWVVGMYIVYVYGLYMIKLPNVSVRYDKGTVFVGFIEGAHFFFKWLPLDIDIANDLCAQYVPYSFFRHINCRFLSTK